MKGLGTIALTGILTASLLSVSSQIMNNMNSSTVQNATSKACTQTIYGFMDAIYDGSGEAAQDYFMDTTESWVDVFGSLFNGVEFKTSKSVPVKYDSKKDVPGFS